MNSSTFDIGITILCAMDTARNPLLDVEREAVMLSLCDYVSFFIGIDGVVAKVLISDTITHGSANKTWCISK